MLVEVKDGYLIFLNKRLVKHAIRADLDKGWVEVPDIASMTPIDNTKRTVVAGKDPDPQAIIFPTKKLYGAVSYLQHPETKKEQ